MIASITSFKLKNWWRYGSFSLATYSAIKQARRSGGLVRLWIRPIELKTLTVWKSIEDLQRFRNGGAHRSAMKRSDSFGAIKIYTWETDTIPSWEQAIKLFKEKQD